MEIIDVNCPNCGAKNKIYPEDEDTVCPNCMTSFNCMTLYSAAVEEKNKKVNKSFTFTRITKGEYEILERAAKADFRTLTSLITVHIKELAQKLKRESKLS